MEKEPQNILVKREDFQLKRESLSPEAMPKQTNGDDLNHILQELKVLKEGIQRLDALEKTVAQIGANAELTGALLEKLAEKVLKG